jgi:hypothetical protein
MKRNERVDRTINERQRVKVWETAGERIQAKGCIRALDFIRASSNWEFRLCTLYLGQHGSSGSSNPPPTLAELISSISRIISHALYTLVGYVSVITRE